MPSQFKKVLDEISARHRSDHVKGPKIIDFNDHVGIADGTRQGAMPPSARQYCAAQDYLTEADHDARLECPEPNDTFSIDDLKKYIEAGVTQEQVSILRRRFAQYNHPDRSHFSQRDRATELMAQANDLLDSASAECKGVR